MKRLLLVQTYPGANGAVARHFPYYAKSGCERVVGITTLGGRCSWPGESVSIGPDSYIKGAHLPSRLLRTLEYGLTQGAEELVVIEWDTCFFKPLPETMPAGFCLNVTGGGVPNAKANQFYHNPWCMDAATARKTVEIGDQMLAAGEYECGSPDVFLGRITDLAGIPVNSGVFRNYSRNSFDNPTHLMEARQAYRDGVHCIHGIKRESDLTFILAP